MEQKTYSVAAYTTDESHEYCFTMWQHVVEETRYFINLASSQPNPFSMDIRNPHWISTHLTISSKKNIESCHDLFFQCQIEK